MFDRRRREFITLLSGAAVAWPLAARAQQPSIPIIGFLSSTSATPYKPFVDAFSKGLRERGYVEGKNVALEYRWADGRYDRLAGFADDLVRLHASVIVAVAPPAARAAKAATSSIPIVFSTSGDPVALGLVSSLNRPGSNLTGVNLMLFSMSAKRLDLLTKLAPEASTIGLLVNPNNPSTVGSLADSEAAAQALGKKVLVARAGTERDIDRGFDQFVQQRVRASSVEADPYLLARRDQIVARAARLSLPAIYPHREYVEVGGLASYGTDLFDGYRQLGIYTARVLNGESPANLPVMQVTKFEMVINMNTAKMFQMVIPPNVLTLADGVIE
jgi:putative tryptophan/tyrosine transport system substrate-binding protein